MAQIVVNNVDIRIMDCYTYSKKEYYPTLGVLRIEYPNNLVLRKRGDDFLVREWATHSLCYKLGILRERTADCDLDYPQKWYMNVAYVIIGSLALLFLK